MENSLNMAPESAFNLQALVRENLIEMEQADKGISEFYDVREKKDEKLIRTVAHDLRNPLGGISSLVDVLMEGDELNNEQRDLLNLVKETAKYSLHMVNELLEKKNQSFTQRELTDVWAIITNSVNLLQHRVAAKNQQLIVAMPDDGKLISVNKEGIARLMDNLLTNAIKFTPEGGVIRVAARQHKGMLEISVKDNGIGIPKRMQATLFDGCATGRKGTAGEQSYGLGLPICKQIAEEHGGKISVKSRVGQGTTFLVSFPAQPGQVSNLVA